MNFRGNFVDLIILGFLIFNILTSFRRGFISLFFELIGFILALFGALNLYFLPAVFLTNYFSVPKAFSNAIGFFVVWMFIELVYYFLVRQFIKMFPVEVLKSKVNVFLSPLPSLANGLAVVAFSLLVIVSLPVPAGAKQLILTSQIGGPITSSLMSLQTPVKNIFGEAIKGSLTFLTVKPQSNESLNLKFTQKDTSVDHVSESEMFNFVNAERVKRGIPALIFDSRLQEVARLHSRDMFERGYFSHYSPEGEDVGGRLEKAGVIFLVAGENLAYAPTVGIAHQGLMDSPGHRENILDSQYHKLGVGVLDGGIYGKMFTQVFLN